MGTRAATGKATRWSSRRTNFKVPYQGSSESSGWSRNSPLRRRQGRLVGDRERSVRGSGRGHFPCRSRETRHRTCSRYSCHEGNYAMPNILSAARADEKLVEEYTKKGLQNQAPRNSNRGRRRAAAADRTAGSAPALRGADGAHHDPVRCRRQTTAAATVALTMWVTVSVGYGQEVPRMEVGVGHAAAGVRDPNLPPDESAAEEQLATSPRRSEWAEIKVTASGFYRTFVVYPQRDYKSGRRHSPARRSGFDRLAASNGRSARQARIHCCRSGSAVREVPERRRQRGFGARNSPRRSALTLQSRWSRLNAVREYTSKMPTANGPVATVGLGGR